MNQDQVMSLVRGVFIFIGGVLVTKGWLSVTDSTVLVTGMMALVGAVATLWPIAQGILAHTHTAMIKSVQAADNNVDVVKAGSGGVLVDPTIKPDLPKK